MAFNLVIKRFFRHNIFRPSGYFLLPSNCFSNMGEQPVKSIVFDNLKEKILNKSIILIDVREPNELKDDGKIPHSVNIPLGQIAEAFQLPNSEFLRKYGIDKPTESDDFVITCRSGKRATNAFNKLLPLGYNNILVYSGSFLDWKEKGGPIEKD